jgi:cell division inhibitor SulA
MIKNIDKLIMLMDEIAIAKSRLEPHDTGHIHTSISWLQQRVEEVKKELEKVYIDGNDREVKLNKNIWNDI